MAKSKPQRTNPEILLKYSHEKLSNSSQNPPPGYTFVSKGNVYVTRHCRTLTNEAGKTLWVVHHPINNIRLGLHVPTDVFIQVQANEAATAEHRQTVVAIKDGKDLVKARGVRLRLYPRVPLESAELILSHGYLKGSGRVGRTSTLDDEEKMKLATAAHVRHKLTNYESLLRERRKGRKHGHQNENVRDEVRREISGDVRRILTSWGPIDGRSDKPSAPKATSPKHKVEGPSSILVESKDGQRELRERQRKQRKRNSSNTHQQQQVLVSKTTSIASLASSTTEEIAVATNEEPEIGSKDQESRLSRQSVNGLDKGQRPHMPHASQRYAYIQEDWIDDSDVSAASEDSDSDSSTSYNHLSDDEALDDTGIHTKELKAIQEISKRLAPQYTASQGRVTRQSLKHGNATCPPAIVAGGVTTNKERRISAIREELEAYKATGELIGATRRRKRQAYRRAKAARAALAHQWDVSTFEPQNVGKVQKAIRKAERCVRKANSVAKKVTKQTRAFKAEFKVKQETADDGLVMLYEHPVSKGANFIVRV
ncbi:MAG: hypothetical protein M1812_002459 [Candelaria pacifica]|nr:MAG: hypothetical protein M1812_002459 [Candelaria pacifica]